MPGWDPQMSTVEMVKTVGNLLLSYRRYKWGSCPIFYCKTYTNFLIFE